MSSPLNVKKTPLLTTKVIPVAGPLIGLGGLLYGIFGLHRFGSTLIISGALILSSYVISLVSTPFKSAFLQVSTLVSKTALATFGAYRTLSSSLARLVFSLLLVLGIFYLASFFGWVGVRYVTEEERTAIAHLKTADGCLERDDYVCATQEVEKARTVLPEDIRVYESDIRSRVLKLAVDELYFHNASADEIRHARIDCDFLQNRNPGEVPPFAVPIPM